MTLIPKVARNATAWTRTATYFPNARTAFRAFLEGASLRRDDSILLPAYIGWSQREGSGVFDPVMNHGLRANFYQMTARLDIDLEDLERHLRVRPTKAVVIIHYFGRVDPAYAEAVALARRYGALVLEDEAHALFSDLVAGQCGRLGDAAIFSLHKLLPVESGGMLLVNPNAAARGFDMSSLIEKGVLPEARPFELSPWSFDLAGMAKIRRRNTTELEALLKPLAGRIDPLWQHYEEGSVLQSFPVVVRTVSRDQLYERMNQAGFGVVSLYHTLIEPLRSSSFVDAMTLSGRILNLPVHHEATLEQLSQMVAELNRQTTQAGPSR